MLLMSFPPAWACRKRVTPRPISVSPAICLILILAFFMVGCVGISSGPNSSSGGPLSVSANLATGTVGASYYGTVAVTGGKPPYSLSISSGKLPPGLALSSSTGAIVGMPTSSGSFTFNVVALDGSNASVTTQATLSISQGQLTLSPATVALTSQGTQQFQATLNGTSVKDAAWSASQGTISSTGLFTAPSVTSTTEITVTANRSTYNQNGTATVTVAPAGTVAISISPTTATIASSAQQQFTATVVNTANKSVTWSATQGTISASGLFTAPKVAQNTTVTVTVTSVADPTKSATATITVLAAPPMIVTISPTSATVASAAKFQFSATVQNSNNTSVTWTSSIGTISSTGLFTAPTVNTNSTGTVTVTSVADPTKFASATVTVLAAPQVIVTISPTTATVASAAKFQFSATVQNNNNTSVTWTSSIGSVSSTGLFTAPTVTSDTNGTVTVTSVADPTKSATASVTVTAGAIPPLQITTSSLLSAISGIPYTATLTATGGTLPYTWTISTGQLPPGLALSTAGVISGTATTTGQFDFTVKVDDSSSPSKHQSQPLTLTVDAPAANSLAIDFFSMHENHPSSPWPSVSIGGERLWDADNVGWAITNTADGVYDWTALDDRLLDAQTHGIDLLLDLGRTPVWAQCNAGTQSPCIQTPGCSYSDSVWGGGPGQCYWPEDLNTNGTGTNKHFKDWVTAVVTHSVNSTTGHIRYYEIWNEPNQTTFFRGTTAQLVRMAQDAACIIKGVGPNCTKQGIDPTASILTPAATFGGSSIDDFLNGFLGTGGAQVVDVIAYHGYDGTSPEKVATLVSTIKSGSLTTYNQNGKPLFDTEFSWGLGNPINDPDQQMGFIARSLILHWSSGVDRVYWYSWDTSGTMWVPAQMTGCTTPDPSGNGFTCQSTLAYATLQDWILGATISQTCSSFGTVWTCTFTKPGSYEGLVVWDTAQTCNNGFCTGSTYVVPPGSNYIHVRNLSGQVTNLTRSTVTIGYKPILLDNQ